MPHRRHELRRVTKRILAKNREQTADIRPLVELAPYGPYRQVKEEDCDQVFLAKSVTPGASLRPGTSVLAVQDRNGLTVLESAPPGRGGVAPIQSEQEFFEVGFAEAAYLAFFADDATHLTVKSLDADGGLIQTVHDNVEVTSSSAPLALISGDPNVPDNSIAIGLQVIDAETSQVATLGTLPSGDLLASDGVYYDTVTQLLYFASTSFITFQKANLHKAATNASSLTLAQTHTLAVDTFSNFPAVVWAADRAILFYWITVITGCAEFPFAGGGVVDRASDTPTITATGATQTVAPAASRYFVDVDTTFFTAERMPLTSGDAIGLAWPASIFHSGGTAYATLRGDILSLWPVLKTVGGSEVYIMEWDVTGIAPSVANNLTQVASATTGPLTPLAVLPVVA